MSRFKVKVVCLLSAIVLGLNIFGFTATNVKAAQLAPSTSYSTNDAYLQRNPVTVPASKQGFYLILLPIVGYTVAQIIIEEAIKNGIQSACNKYKNKWGVTKACTIAGFKPK
ncbi:hypothetical protein U8V72_27545 [Priestia filamentosa]|uniref:hypothetical protein n=1 Tax=Priestia filamentosa TaxID=1402861 RepID=UPI003979E4E2